MSCVSLKKWIDFDIWPVKHFLQIFLFLLLNFALRVLYSRLIWILGNSQTFKEPWLSWKPWKKQPLTVKPSVCVYISGEMCVCVCVCTHTQSVVLVTSEALWPLFSVPPTWRKKKVNPTQNKSDFISIIWLQVSTQTPEFPQTETNENNPRENAKLDIQHGRLKAEQGRASWNCFSARASQQPRVNHDDMVHFVIICASFVLLEPGSPRVYKLRPAQARCDARSPELTFKAEHLKSLNERLSDQKQILKPKAFELLEL